MKKRPIFILCILAVILSIAILPIGMQKASAFTQSGSIYDPYLITSASDLEQFATDVNSGVNTMNKYYKLTADIDISSYENWTPIGSFDKTFKGYFDGNNYTISGLTIKASTEVANSYFGLFGAVTTPAGQDFSSARLKNIKLTNVSVECTSNNSEVYVGSLAGYVTGIVVENCSASTAEGKTVKGPNAGGLIGYTTLCNLKNLSNNCDVTAERKQAGGITSIAYGSKLENLSNSGTVIQKGSQEYECGAGGIIGVAPYCSSLTGLINSGNVSGEVNVGGIVGYVTGPISGAHTKVSDSYNTGTIISSGRNTGGLIGQCQLTDIGHSFNFGIVNGTQYTGGIIGRLGNMDSNGVNANIVNYSITNCYNTGSVSGTSCVGGIAGLAFTYASVTKTYSAGSVEGSGYVGALIGDFSGKESSNNYYAPAINPGLTDLRKGTGTSNTNWNATPLTAQQMTNNSILISGNENGFMSGLGSEWVKRTNDASIYYPELFRFYYSSESEVKATSRRSVMATIPLTYSFSFSPQPVNVNSAIILPTASAGYKSAEPQTVLVSNTGTGDTGEFTLSLARASESFFSLSKATMASLAVDGSDSFTVTPKTGLAPGIYRDYVQISCSSTKMKASDRNKGFLIEFTVVESTTKDIIDLSPFADKIFTTQTEGYDSVDVHTVDVSNTGTENSGELTVSLSGTNADSFTLSKTTIADLAANGSDNFTVIPKSGLPVGSYTATVTVSGDNMTPKSFDVSFTVKSKLLTATGGKRTVTVKDVTDGAALKLYKSDDTIVAATPNKNPDGTYTYTDVEPGTYYVTETVDGIESERSNTATVSDVTTETPSVPALTGGTKTIIVKDVTEGATLKLYKQDGIIVIATPTKNPDGTYTYTDIEPGIYYVTETVDGIESEHSNTVTVSDVTPETPETPSVPTLTGGTKTIIVKDVTEGATLKLYRLDGTVVIATPTKNPDGTYTYTDIEPGIYYVTETVDGIESEHSNTVTVSDVTPETPSVPVITGGTKTIVVKDVTEGATLKLYKLDGTIVNATPTKNIDGTYTYTNVGPGTYYVIQTVNGIESGHSNMATVSEVTPETPYVPTPTGGVSEVTPKTPSAPTLTVGTKKIVIKDVAEGATLKLYKADGTIVTATPTKNADGTYTYTNVDPGTYYVIQTVDGTESEPSSTVTVSDVTPKTPSAPTLTVGTKQIVIKDVTDGATLKLYKADGTIVTAAPTKNADGTYTYTNVDPGTYYVIQTVGGTESESSSMVTVSDVKPKTPSTPTLAGGAKKIVIKDVTDGATLKLYKADGTIVTVTPIKNTNGTYTYKNVKPGTYYVTQTVNGVESKHSSTFAVTENDKNKAGNDNGNDSYKSSTDNSDDLPKTGDNGSAALPTGLLSLSCLIAFVMLNRRKQNS